MQATQWDHRLVVRADGKNLIGHAGVVLLRKVAARVGPTRALVQLACAIVIGATNVLEAERLQRR